MTIDWLYNTAIDMSLLIGLILLLRPIVRRLLGANIVYWLWSLPLLSIFLPERPPRPATFIEKIIPSGSDTQLTLLLNSTPDTWYVSSEVPWAWIWVIGFLFCLAIQIILICNFRKLLASNSISYELHANRLIKLIEQSNFKSVQILITDLPHAPFAAGLFNPSIVLPTKFEQCFSEEEQYWILRHEITHVKRKDLWMQLLAETIRTVFWFNPIVHIALRSFREDQEYACDQAVLSDSSSEDRYHYGRALLLGSSPQLVPSVLTFFKKNMERYLMLAKHKKSKLNTILGAGLCLVVGIFAFTTAPDSIAQVEQRPVFADVYDANAPIKFTGKIARVDYGEFLTWLHVDANNEDGSVTPWLIEGSGFTVMHEAGLNSNALYIGRSVTIRGYQSIDRNCTPKCKLNGRDITFADQ